MRGRCTMWRWVRLPLLVLGTRCRGSTAALGNSMRSLTTVVIALCSVTAGAASQSTLTIPERTTCPDCSIRRTLISTLHDTGRTALLGGWTPAIAVSSKGTVYLADMDRHAVAVFSRAGTLIGRVGRKGAGPGEFGLIDRIVVTPGDSILVFDVGNRRMSLFSPTMALVREAPLPGQVLAAIARPDGSVLANMVIASSDQAGFPIHVLDSRGTITGSFARTDGGYRVRYEGALSRSMAAHGTQYLYVARHQEYVVELWDLHTRSLVRMWERRAPWFRPWRILPRLAEPPPTSIQNGLWRSRTGLLWVLVQVPDRDFRVAVEKGGVHGETVRDMSKWLDTMIEVIDPGANRVLVRQRLDRVMLSFVGNGFAYSSVVDRDGVPAIEIWQLDLERGKR